MADKSLAKALKRKIGLNQDFLLKIRGQRGEISLLMNPSRRKIFEYVCNNPCSHLRAISKACGYSVQNGRWHLDKLEKADLIEERTKFSKKIFSPLKNIIDFEECGVLELLNRKDIKNVYLFIVKNPNATQKELTKSLSIYQQKLSRILISLENYDLITANKTQRSKTYAQTNRIKDFSSAYDSKNPSFEMLLMEALSKDSLNPTLESRDSNILKIKVDVGSGKSVIKIHTNPFETIKQKIKKK